MRFFPVFLLAFFFTGFERLPAQAPPNLVINGGFESSYGSENLWAGVDRSGCLAGEKGQVPILSLGGAISDAAMPMSVSIADMNADGLPDLVTMDVLGYLRVFFNSGSKEEPKFDSGDLGAIFLTRISAMDPLLGGRDAPYARQAPRVFATDLLKSTKKDLIIGNYLGEVLVIPNMGTPQTPDFRQPPDVGRSVIPTTKNPQQRWGNVFAPATWDWNSDGKEDLLLGEGSYSANNIHLLLNRGAGGRPAFDESSKHIIAFGDGLEQLAPAVVDYNGDGSPDLLVSERSGRIAVYLNKSGGSKDPAAELPFASFIQGSSSSSPLSFSGISSIAASDMNGDGLFDLVVGKSNGRIAMALNRGSRSEPKFDSPVDLKGAAPSKPFAMPSGWEVNYGLERGNFLGYLSVVDNESDPNSQPPEGKSCLKAGYLPSPNKIMPAPAVFTPAFGKFMINDIDFRGDPARMTRDAPARFFLMSQRDRMRLTPGASYILTFKVKGRFTDAQALVGWSGKKVLSEPKVIHGERGTAQVTVNEIEGKKSELVRFSPGPGWTEVRKEFRASLDEKELADLKQFSGVLQFSFTIPISGGEAYFDDVRVVERK